MTLTILGLVRDAHGVKQGIIKGTLPARLLLCLSITLRYRGGHVGWDSYFKIEHSRAAYSPTSR